MAIVEDVFFLGTKTIIALLRVHKKARKILLIALPTLILIIIGVVLFSPYALTDTTYTTLGILTGCLTVLFISVLVSYTNLKTDTEILVDNLNTIKQERERIIEKIGNDSVINTIQLSLNQLTEYYTINLSQAKTSYRWSITAIIVGLITLIAGAWLIFFQVTPNITVGIITGISGILIEFIGASNIYIYNKSLSQLNLYFKELINIQDTMLAIELCEKIDNSNPRKIEITEKIILNLISRNSKVV